MSEYLVTSEDLTAVADAIRAKSGGSESLEFPDGFVSEIGSIPSGGSDDTLNAIIGRAYLGELSLTGTVIGANALRNCSGITLVCMPNCTQMNTEGLKEMNDLQTVDLGNCASIGDMGFQSDSKLTTIILRRTAGVCSLKTARVFLYTRFVSGGAGGTVYVPSALIASYKTASNWSTLEGYGVVNWVAIEGSQYENYYADGTPIPSS